MANFTFSHKYSGGWFFQDLWSPWTAYATNTSSQAAILSGVVFRFLSCNSGGQEFHIGGNSWAVANGSGCKMYCKLTYPDGTSIKSNTVVVPPTTTSNITGNLSDNTNCWFVPRPGPDYTFYFDNPKSVAANAQVTLDFYVTEWTGGGSSTGYPCIQVYSQGYMDEPTSFIVTFNLDGGTRTGGGALTQTIVNGQSATPPTCTKPGYRFLRWDGIYTNVTSNRTITAMWEALPIWRYDGGKWVQCLQSHNYDGTKWNDVDTFEFSTTWKEL